MVADLLVAVATAVREESDAGASVGDADGEQLARAWVREKGGRRGERRRRRDRQTEKERERERERERTGAQAHHGRESVHAVHIQQQ